MDFLVAELKCPRCGTLSEPDASTNMSTHIRDDRLSIMDIRVGTKLEMCEDLEEVGYLRLRSPSGSTVRVLETWECPTCHVLGNWAEIEFKIGASVVNATGLVEGVVKRIEAIELDRSHVARAHYVSTEVIDVVHEFSGLPYPDLVSRDLAGMLLEHFDLPGG